MLTLDTFEPMKITIDTADERPIYRQIADEIKALLVSGDLAEGASLPSVRQLAADLGVNMNTIATAYRELQDEGLIIIKHGAGALVSSRRTNEDNSSRERLRKSVHLVLTQLLLAGWRREDIMSLVSNELSDLLEGGK